MTMQHTTNGYHPAPLLVTGTIEDRAGELLSEYDDAIQALDQALATATEATRALEDADRKVRVAQERCHLLRAALATLPHA